MKSCITCGEFKLLEQFYRANANRDGRFNECIACQKLRRQRWEKENPEKNRAKALRWAKNNRAKVNAGKRRYNKERPEMKAAMDRRYVERHAEEKRQRDKRYRDANRTRRNEVHAKWRKLRPDIGAAQRARRKARLLQATPAWANLFFISEIYRLAALRTRLLGVKHHVDHIVPLHSPMVCGLHCEANLQVVRASVNVTKQNRHWPDMPL